MTTSEGVDVPRTVTASTLFGVLAAALAGDAKAEPQRTAAANAVTNREKL
jgi:hypothetical protein